MPSTAPTVEECVADLPEDRRAAITTVRDLVNEHLPGAGAVRLKTLDHLALEPIAEVVERLSVDAYIARHREAGAHTKAGRGQRQVRNTRPPL
jgi:hypothetical protein